ncbi:hypothetical protein KVR01_002545 [Diaporthe batatas]|uniref:uncharacterized protein n=1 Tax=Diaporthe batatas TaxID=748121 RepID=UPI001D05A62B|nr:uncharacterized protein KVR01_002545 [Diaporthe batatas]KAG8166856.1 hypothetical protein KVR01_002545 [Diaporthe batatas]
MSEAIAALGLAANVLQVLDYGRQFVVAAWIIHDSRGDDLENVSSLKTVSQNLSNVIKQLKPTPRHRESELDKEMSSLVAEGHDLSMQILALLKKAGFQDDGKRTKMGTIKAAFFNVFKSEQLRSMESRLDRIQSRLTLTLVASFREYTMSSLEEQRHLLRLLSADASELLEERSEEMPTDASTVAMGTKAVKYLSNKAASSPTLMKTVMMDMVNVIFDNDELVADHRARRASKFELSNQKLRVLHEKFLTKLQYDGIYHREDTVPVAHQKTFHWIFERAEDQTLPWADFCRFLESEEHQQYWITGKPGAGKSTLMKFITQPVSDPSSASHKAIENGIINLRCTEYLKTWAGDRPLSVACFYFWAAGSDIQTSKEGLFRTLLHQLLSANKEIISEISPDRWESLCIFDSDPKPILETELRTLMSRTVQRLCSTSKVCLFLDGLDEFTGSHEDLVNYFQSLLCYDSLKICFASRPWVVFEEAFKEQPHLMLQHLTRNDRKAYVTSHFQDNNGFRRLQGLEPMFANSLLETIVEKSQGVFLWVSLVVDSLLDGMRDADRVSDLQKRLDETPRDLEELFQRMLEDLGPKHVAHIAQYFQIMAACPRPLPAILLFFADEEEDDFSIKLPVQRYDWSEFNARVDEMRVRLNSCGKGLLELNESQDDKATTYDKKRVTTVTYLHRTLKDFLEQPGPRETISKVTSPSFDARFRLSSGYLALYKTCHHHIPGQRLSDASCAAVLHCLGQMSSSSTEAGSRMLPILENFERILSSRLESYANIGVLLRQLTKVLESEGAQVPPTSLIPTRFRNTTSSTFPSIAAFLTAAIYCQATPYIMTKVKSGFDVGFADSTPLSSKAISIPSQAKKESSISRALGSMLGNSSSKKKEQAQLDQVPSIEDWLLYNVIMFATTGVSVSIPLIESLLNRGARPDFSFQICPAGIERDCSTWQLVLAESVNVFAGNYTGLTPFKFWEEVITIMLAWNVSLDKRTVAGSLDVLREHRKLEPRELDRKQMTEQVLKALRTMRKGHDSIASIGYTLRRV